MMGRCPLPGVCLAALLANAGLTAFAQPVPGEGVATAYREAFTLLEAGQTDEAAAQLQELVDRFGRDAPATIGPSFGNIYYHLGQARAAQNRAPEAIEAFRLCYTRFPNPPDATGAKNVFAQQALSRWAELEQARGRPRAAMALLGRAIKECKDRRLQNRLLANLAFAYRDLNRRAEARRVLETVRKRLGSGGDQTALARRTLAELALLDAEQGRFLDVAQRLEGTATAGSRRR